MSMFFYSQGPALNVVVDLTELEALAAILKNPGSAFNAGYARWKEYGDAVGRAIATGGRIHLTVGRAEPGAVAEWRGALDDADALLKARADETLGSFAERSGATLRRETVEIIVL